MNFHRRYIVYGVVVDSEFPFATVSEVPRTQSQPDVRMAMGAADFFLDKARDLPPPAEDWIQYSTLPDGDVFIRVNDILQTVVSADGRNATCAWAAGADRTAFEANFLNFVLSTALTLQGEEPFHSTVLDIDGHVVGLLGPSGAGKSTLAACLIGQGADLVTDDMLRLQFRGADALVHAGPYRLKLHADSARRFLPCAAQRGYFNTITGKVLVQPSENMPAYDVPRRLNALFWIGDHLEDGSEPQVLVRRMSGLPLVRALIASAMNVRYHSPERLERRLRFAEHVAGAVPVYALEYPRDFAIMNRVAGEIRRAIST